MRWAHNLSGEPLPSRLDQKGFASKSSHDATMKCGAVTYSKKFDIPSCSQLRQLRQPGFVSSYFIFVSTTIQNLCINHGLEPPSTMSIMATLALLLTPLGWIRRISHLV